MTASVETSTRRKGRRGLVVGLGGLLLLLVAGGLYVRWHRTGPWSDPTPLSSQEITALRAVAQVQALPAPGRVRTLMLADHRVHAQLLIRMELQGDVAGALGLPEWKERLAEPQPGEKVADSTVSWNSQTKRYDADWARIDSSDSGLQCYVWKDDGLVRVVWVQSGVNGVTSVFVLISGLQDAFPVEVLNLTQNNLRDQWTWLPSQGSACYYRDSAAGGGGK